MPLVVPCWVTQCLLFSFAKLQPQSLCSLIVHPPRTSWLSYQRIFNMPVLVALNAADTARGLEAMSDTQVVQEAMQVRRRGTYTPRRLSVHG